MALSSSSPRGCARDTASAEDDGAAMEIAGVASADERISICASTSLATSMPTSNWGTGASTASIVASIVVRSTPAAAISGSDARSHHGSIEIGETNAADAAPSSGAGASGAFAAGFSGSGSGCMNSIGTNAGIPTCASRGAGASVGRAATTAAESAGAAATGCTACAAMRGVMTGVMTGVMPGVTAGCVAAFGTAVASCVTSPDLTPGAAGCATRTKRCATDSTVGSGWLGTREAGAAFGVAAAGAGTESGALADAPNCVVARSFWLADSRADACFSSWIAIACARRRVFSRSTSRSKPGSSEPFCAAGAGCEPYARAAADICRLCFGSIAAARAVARGRSAGDRSFDEGSAGMSAARAAVSSTTVRRPIPKMPPRSKVRV